MRGVPGKNIIRPLIFSGKDSSIIFLIFLWSWIAVLTTHFFTVLFTVLHMNNGRGRALTGPTTSTANLIPGIATIEPGTTVYSHGMIKRRKSAKLVNCYAVLGTSSASECEVYCSVYALDKKIFIYYL